MAGEMSTEEMPSTHLQVVTYSFGSIRPFSLMVAVKLGIPDAVQKHGGGGGISLPKLAAAVGIPEARVPAFRRLMRGLSVFGVFRRDVKRQEGGDGDEETYSPTALSEQLVSDSPSDAARLLLVILHPLFLTAWTSMPAWLRGDGPKAPSAFEAAHGQPLYAALRQLPEYSTLLNGTTARDSCWDVELIARKHPELFRGLTSLVDVGGGNGTAAKAIKNAFPEIRCTVLDDPRTVAASPAIDGVEFVAGDMFEHVPPAGAVLLKGVLHLFDNDGCIKVLRKCKEAIGSSSKEEGRVIIMDVVMGDGGGGGDDKEEINVAKHLFDLHMLALVEGKERSEAEWQKIIAAAGFRCCEIIHALPTLSVIQAHP